MKKEIVKLQELMRDRGIDVYYVPAGDPHCSEYANDHYKTSELLSGLTAECQELIVTSDRAYVWTDGRFFLQAEKQLAGSGIELMRMREPGVPTTEEFLLDLLKKHVETHNDICVVGCDGATLPAGTGISWEKAFAKLVEASHTEEELPERRELLTGSGKYAGRVRLKCDEDLGGMVWGCKRPVIEPSGIWKLPASSAGKSADEKIAEVRDEMGKRGADWLLISDLAEAAWLLNWRGADIMYTPVFFSYVLMSRDEVRVYVMPGALSRDNADDNDRVNADVADISISIDNSAGIIKAVQQHEAEGIYQIRDYGDITCDVAALPEDSRIWLDSRTVNYSLYTSIPDRCSIIDEMTPAAAMKTIKNEREIAGTINAHIKDGAAVTRFIRWVKDRMEAEEAGGNEACSLTEIGAADRLEAFRREMPGCFDLSFETISGYGANGAIIHYAPTPETNAVVRPEGFLLVDSGGQYIDGTTDITRTIAAGPLSREMIEGYTRVLKGHIALSKYRITPGTKNSDMDGAARAALKEAGLDFNHGVSHGVGHVLAVHEGPAGIRRNDEPVCLKAGMIVSNEPGLYVEGKFGIRIENEILIRTEDGEACEITRERPEECGQILVSEPITFAPYEREAIDVSMLTEEEIEWIDRYHAMVREKLMPLLADDEGTADFLIRATEPLLSCIGTA